MRLIFTLFLASLACFSVRAQIDTTKSDSTNNIPVFSLTADDLESDQSQDVSGLLQSSRDVFTGIAGYNFSAARFRMRGYSSENYNVYMNGAKMNLVENGFAIWSFWGGLNDVTRYPQVKNGIAANDYAFGGIGGFSNLNLRASSFRKGNRFSYAIANRTYRNRIMYTHSTGWMKGGWAITASGSGRWSKEGYVEGTYYRGASYFVSVEKKINAKHSLNLAGFGVPTVQARSGIALQEAYDLTGSNYYNPYWGYQTSADGATQLKRNARVRQNNRPSLFLTHYWKIDDKSKLETTLNGTFGSTGNTNINWYDAADPRPDYYKYLPSYYAQDNPTQAAALANSWANDPSVSQLDWDHFYFANQKNLYALTDADGQTGNTVEGNRSKYIVENFRLDPRQVGLNSAYTKEINENLQFAGGIRLDFYKSKNYKVLEDLLGGDFWIDVDQFAEQESSNADLAQNDLNNPNRVIRQGDEFGFNYDIHQNYQEAYGQLEIKRPKVDGYLGANVSRTSFWRVGNYLNGRFQDNSFGASEKQNFSNIGIKAGATYKVTGRHFLTANLAYLTRAPFIRNAYVSPRTRDMVVQGLESNKIMSGDVNYIVRYPNFKSRATAFYTEIKDQTWARSFYHDEYRTFVNYAMTGVDNLHMGVELAAEGTIFSTVVLSGAFTTGQYLYNSRPTATITRDNSNELLAENKTVYLKNYRIGGMPQTATSLGIKYNSPKFWFIGTNINFFSNIYLDPNPDRRTAEAVDLYVESDPQWSEVLDQTKLDNGYAVNAYVGKSWKIKGSYLRANLSVNNVLNNRDFRTGGYEQLRYDSQNIGKFPPKFGYMYGTSYFFMVTYLFK